MSVIFAKTLKGRDEIETRANGLSAVLRRVLIFIDGHRTITELERLPKIGDLQDILRMLIHGGYIEPLSDSKKAPVQSSPTVAAPKPQSQPVQPPAQPSLFRVLPAQYEPEKFQMARNFMINTLQAFVGTFGASGLISRLQAANSHQELRDLFEDWHAAIIATRAGRKDEKELRRRLLEII